MQSDQTPPIFLERRSYRQRRMMDAVRLLPLIGLLLWLLPTLWSLSNGHDVEPVKTSQAIKYVFGVWVCLILSGGLLWRYLIETAELAGRSDAETTTDPD